MNIFLGLLLSAFAHFESIKSIHPYDTRQAPTNDIILTQKNTLEHDASSIRFTGAKSSNRGFPIIKKSVS